ncbi:MAG: DEAD/DEAH box helicase family protein [Nitrososphaerota archaeon]
MYDRQREALRKLLENIVLKKNFRMVFQMPTGAGKTVVVAGLIMALYHKVFLKKKDIVLYLTPRIILKRQVEERFDEIFQIFKDPYKGGPFRIERPKNDILGFLKFYFGKWGEVEDRILILIITPNALHKFIEEYRDKIQEFSNMKRVRLILMDEVHRVYFGPNISRSIERLLDELAPKDSCVIGLSATPIRQAIERIGSIVYSLSSKQAMMEGILAKKLRIYSTNTRTKLLERIGKDEWSVAVVERAEKYCDEILNKLSEELKDLYPESPNPLLKRIPKTLIVAANITEAYEIANNLRRRISELRPPTKVRVEELVRVAHYKIPEADEEINRFREQDQGILVTVNMADIGFDDENLEVLVIARPIRTPIAYVQIRGRVLRRPKNTSDNIKALKYAVIIDLTRAAQHEESVEKVELGEFGVEDFEELERDLKGEGEVEKVRGEVAIDPEYKIIEVPPISLDEIQEEILKILRVPYGLSTHRIKEELAEKGFKIEIEIVEKACINLAKNNKLILREGNVWFYPYEVRIKDILKTNRDKIWSIKELMDEAGIPITHDSEVEVRKILNDIIKKVLSERLEEPWRLIDLPREVKIRGDDLLKIIPRDFLDQKIKLLIISSSMKKFDTLENLKNMLRKEDAPSWIFIRYPLWFEKHIEECVKDVTDLKYLISRKMLNERQGEISLRRCIAVVKALGIERRCVSLEEVERSLSSLKGHDIIEVEFPWREIYKVYKIDRKIFEIAQKLGFEQKYYFLYRQNKVMIYKRLIIEDLQIYKMKKK